MSGGPYDQTQTLVIVGLGIAVAWVLSQSPEGQRRSPEQIKDIDDPEYLENLRRYREPVGDYSELLTPLEAHMQESLTETAYADLDETIGYMTHAMGAFGHEAGEVQRETKATLRAVQRAWRQLDPSDFTTQPVTRESLKAETEAIFSILDESDITYLKDGDALDV